MLNTLTGLASFGTRPNGRGAVLAFLQTLRRWWQERRMTGALQELDDAMLKDIGVRRCEIPTIVRACCAEWYNGR